MNNLISLLKINLRENLDTRKFKEDGKKTIGFLVVITLTIIFGILLSSIYSYIFGCIIAEAYLDLSNLILIMLGFSSIFCLATVIFKAKSIFTGKDFETLSAMPIKRRDIIASKIIGLYAIELIYSSIIMIPCGIIATILSAFVGNVEIKFIFEGIVGGLLVPAVPIALGSLLAFLITLIADRFRYSNAISIILYAIVFAGIVSLSLITNMSNSADGADISTYTIFIDTISYLNPVNIFYKLGFTENYLFNLIYIATNILILAIVVIVIAKAYMPVYEIVNNLRGGFKYKRKNLKVKGQAKALLVNDFVKYFKSKNYFLNTISSGIVAIVTTIFFAVLLTSINTEENSLAMYLEYVPKYGYVGAILIISIIGIATPASCAISMEGANFWIIKSLPINYKSYCKNKILMSTIVLGACTLIASLIMIIFIKPSIISIITIILLPIIFVFASSSLGLFINLYYYKLNWKNELEACKNGASMIISMLVDFVFTISVSAITIGLSFLNDYLAAIVGMLFTLAIGLIFYNLVKIKCDNRIKEIE